LLEYCWIVNFIGYVWLFTEAIAAWHGTIIPFFGKGSRIDLARGFFAVANGHLGPAILMNGDALVFHDLTRGASVFIHMSPMLISYTFRWIVDSKNDPTGIHALIPENGDSDITEDLVWNPLKLYMCWWVIYGLWLLTIGHKAKEYGWGRSSF
jgi:hypothetical protein